jgi:drug/metabolite transporter (DMT)-like permease
LNTPLRAYILVTIAMMTWGAAWVAMNILVEIAGPFTIGFYRFLVASILFIGLSYIRGEKNRKIFPRENLKPILASGIFGIFGFSMLSLVGLTFTTAAQASIIAGLNPITVYIFANLIHKEQLQHRWQYLGFLFAFSGILILVGVQPLTQFQFEYVIGNLILILAMVTWGLNSSIAKAGMKTMSSQEFTTASVLVGTILFGIGSLIELNALPSVLLNPVFWMNILFLSILTTVIGFLFYFGAINEVGVTKIGVFISLVPIFGTLLSILLLQEPVYWTFIISLGLIVVSIIIINIPQFGNNKCEENPELS